MPTSVPQCHVSQSVAAAAEADPEGTGMAWLVSKPSRHSLNDS